MIDVFISILSNFKVTDAIDIAIVAYLVYLILGFIKETRAQQLLRGVLVLIAIFFISNIFDLYLLNWILRNFFTAGLFAVIVLFQPELRRGLEQVGRGALVPNQFTGIEKGSAIKIVDELVTAVDDFSATRTGALIAIERNTALNDIIETGVIVDAEISVRLLGNLFYEGSPLHDGAVIIRGDRIYAASCVLPLTEKRTIGRNLGTRHRAGVGLSEVSDALIIIVSEETGIISIAENGTLKRFVDTKTIEKILLEIYLPEDKSVFKRISGFFGIGSKSGSGSKSSGAKNASAKSTTRTTLTSINTGTNTGSGTSSGTSNTGKGTTAAATASTGTITTVSKDTKATLPSRETIELYAKDTLTDALNASNSSSDASGKASSGAKGGEGSEKH